MGKVGHYFGSKNEELRGAILHILRVGRTKEECPWGGILVLGTQPSDHTSGEESWQSDVTKGEVPHLTKARQKASQKASHGAAEQQRRGKEEWSGKEEARVWVLKL